MNPGENNNRRKAKKRETVETGVSRTKGFRLMYYVTAQSR